MASKKHVYATNESQLEKKSQLAVEGALLPWRITWVDTQDDFGRDGFAQLVEYSEGVKHGIAQPETCALQLKSQTASFSETAKQRLEVRHLMLWTAENSNPTVIVVWSQSDNEIRLRTARDAVRELETVNPSWKDQQTATTQFREEHRFASSPESLAELARLVRDELDKCGGRSRFHNSRRRVLLSDLYFGTIKTSTKLTTQGGPTCIVGTGWVDGDLDPADVFAPRLLVNSLLLFEEVWIPIQFFPFAAACLGADHFSKLVRSNRLAFFEYSASIAFTHQPHVTHGEPGIISSPNPHERLLAMIRQQGANAGLSPSISEMVHKATRVVTSALANRALEQTRRDLLDPSIRTLLSLPPKTATEEAVWNWRPVNRLAHLNLNHAVGHECGLDVVELESGLSRVASEKWYASLQFDRTFETIEAFDSALTSVGAPDLGMLVNVLGVKECVEMAESAAAQEFRDWFWDTAALLLASGADVKKAIMLQVGKQLRLDTRALQLPCAFKLRFFEQVNQQYVVGTTGRPLECGFAARGDRGRDVLMRQAKNDSIQRNIELHNALGKLPLPKALCPCRSGLTFAECCGRSADCERNE